jgi:hypothetical protein
VGSGVPRQEEAAEGLKKRRRCIACNPIKDISMAKILEASRVYKN